jgi:hypothetical protein
MLTRFVFALALFVVFSACVPAPQYPDMTTIPTDIPTSVVLGAYGTPPSVETLGEVTRVDLFEYAGVALTLPQPMPLVGDVAESEGKGRVMVFVVEEQNIPNMADYRAMLEAQQVAIISEGEVADDGSFVLSGGQQSVEFLVIYNAQDALLGITAVDRLAFYETNADSLLDTIVAIQGQESIIFDGIVYHLPPHTKDVAVSTTHQGGVMLVTGYNSELTVDEVYAFMATEMARLGHDTVVNHHWPTRDSPYMTIEWQGGVRIAVVQFDSSDGAFSLTVSKNAYTIR